MHPIVYSLVLILYITTISVETILSSMNVVTSGWIYIEKEICDNINNDYATISVHKKLLKHAVGRCDDECICGNSILMILWGRILDIIK